VGDKNPFYGKKHSIEVVEKLRKEKTGKKYSDETNKKKANIGKDNPMYGKSFYDVWVEKYGEEEADIKMNHYKEKKSEQTSGENNPMYGKPALLVLEMGGLDGIKVGTLEVWVNYRIWLM
jgi:hypothetical protein